MALKGSMDRRIFSILYNNFSMKFLPVLFFSLICFCSSAQQSSSFSTAEIFQKIKKLNVLGSVMYIAAHPDDENTRLLAYLSNDKLYRTAYLSMTRGDGGQNLIGDDQGVALGLIRTQELLSARRIDGAEQFFTRAFDFGYSKGPDETFGIWYKEKILSDVVWVIRKFRPDIVITRFPTTGEGGHGHHTASAILAQEAFDAAGDTTRFPEQFKYGVTTWKPVRLLWNTFNFGSVNTTNNHQFKVNTGGYNPLLRESYGEIAAHSRSQHKSQGFGVPSSRGTQWEYFKTIKGSAPENLLMDHVNTTWSRIGAADIGELVTDIQKNFSFQHPEQSVSSLLNVYHKISLLPESNWKIQKLREVKDLIQNCSGLFIEAFAREHFTVPGGKVNLTFSADNRLGIPVSVTSVSFLGSSHTLSQVLPLDETVSQAYSWTVPDTTPISQPYWLIYPMSKGSFTVKNQQLIGKPENDPLSMRVILDFEGTQIPFNIPVRFKANDPVKGEVYQPLFVIPSVEISSSPQVALSINRNPVAVLTHTTINDSSISTIRVSDQYSSNIQKTTIHGINQYFKRNQTNVADTIRFHAMEDHKSFDQYKVLISYPHIPDIIYFPEAMTKLVSVEMKTSGKKAGYIPGAGDKIPEALQQMGYSVTTLAEGDFTKDNLSKFDVIVSGVRAYNIHLWLNDAYVQLMEYVKNGGVLLVQYNTNNNIGPVKAKIGPYPFDISRTRVTNEDAEVTFLNTGNGLLNYPNKITQRDFDHWIQERSTYHAANFASHYQPVLSMHDEGENPQEGSLIYCNYGKGRFVYCGLVLFRELPAGVPGAFRLFANLIAKPKP